MRAIQLNIKIDNKEYINIPVVKDRKSFLKRKEQLFNDLKKYEKYVENFEKYDYFDFTTNYISYKIKCTDYVIRLSVLTNLKVTIHKGIINGIQDIVEIVLNNGEVINLTNLYYIAIASFEKVIHSGTNVDEHIFYINNNISIIVKDDSIALMLLDNN